jgi:hypothetical protein
MKTFTEKLDDARAEMIVLYGEEIVIPCALVMHNFCYDVKTVSEKYSVDDDDLMEAVAMLMRVYSTQIKALPKEEE